MGAAAVPIILAVAGTAVSVYNSKQTAKKQDRFAAEGIRKQAEEQRKANARLNETLNAFEKSGAGDIRDQLSSKYAEQIRLKRAQGLSGVDGSSGSDAYRESVKSGSSEVMDRAGVLQDLFARIDAPRDQRIQEGFERGDLGSDLSVFGRNSAAEDYLTRLRVNAVQRSPYLDIVAAGLSGAASGSASSGGGTGSVPANAGSANGGSTTNSVPSWLFNYPTGKTNSRSTFG